MKVEELGKQFEEYLRKNNLLNTKIEFIEKKEGIPDVGFRPKQNKFIVKTDKLALAHEIMHASHQERGMYPAGQKIFFEKKPSNMITDRLVNIFTGGVGDYYSDSETYTLSKKNDFPEKIKELVIAHFEDYKETLKLMKKLFALEDLDKRMKSREKIIIHATEYFEKVTYINKILQDQEIVNDFIETTETLQKQWSGKFKERVMMMQKFMENLPSLKELEKQSNRKYELWFEACKKMFYIYTYPEKPTITLEPVEGKRAIIRIEEFDITKIE